jgi:hypothetical protein
MVQQPANQQSYPAEQLKTKFSHPKRLDVFFHAGKTLKLIQALLFDSRVPVLRKALFLGSIGAMVIVLFFPDAINETILSTVMPIVGTILGIPLDAGFDWVAFALVGVTLLRYFPAEIVSEHYNSIFGR